MGVRGSKHTEEEEERVSPQFFKIIILGDRGSGKTSYLLRLVENRFNPHQPPTERCNLLMKTISTIPKRPLHCEVWDIPGEHGMDMRRLYYKDVDGVVFIFDGTKSNWKSSVKKWFKEAHSFIQPKPGQVMKYQDALAVPSLIFANKSESKNTVVEADELRNFARELRIYNWEIGSCEIDHMVYHSFKVLALEVDEHKAHISDVEEEDVRIDMDSLKVFGKSIELVHKTENGLPHCVEEMIVFLVSNGLETPGIFRLKTRRSDILDYKEVCDAGDYLHLTKQRDDPIAIAQLFLEYIKSLPEPVFPTEVMKRIVRLQEEFDKEEEDERDLNHYISILASLLQKVSNYNYRLLQETIELIAVMLTASAVNDLTLESINLVFIQLLFPTANDWEVVKLEKVMASLIDYKDYLFDVYREVV